MTTPRLGLLQYPTPNYFLGWVGFFFGFFFFFALLFFWITYPEFVSVPAIICPLWHSGGRVFAVRVNHRWKDQISRRCHMIVEVMIHATVVVGTYVGGQKGLYQETATAESRLVYGYEQ